MSVASQHAPAGGLEVIVVDDARSETTRAVVESQASERPALNLRYLPGASRGPASARNIGWRAAMSRAHWSPEV